MRMVDGEYTMINEFKIEYLRNSLLTDEMVKKIIELKKQWKPPEWIQTYLIDKIPCHKPLPQRMKKPEEQSIPPASK